MAQAYVAVALYLDQHLAESRDVDLMPFRGNMVMDDDGETSDPAFWEDWLHSVGRLPGVNLASPPEALDERQAYEAFILFLERWFDEGTRTEKAFGRLIERLTQTVIPHSREWRRWMRCTERVAGVAPPDLMRMTWQRSS